MSNFSRNSYFYPIFRHLGKFYHKKQDLSAKDTPSGEWHLFVVRVQISAHLRIPERFYGRKAEKVVNYKES